MAGWRIEPTLRSGTDRHRACAGDEKGEPVEPFRILTVCTGNICRSPLAEQLLRSGLAELSDVSIASAGTRALVGMSMTDQAQQISQLMGGASPGEHRARELNVDMLSDAGLVLALSREHRRSVVEMFPRGARRTFTLREFARLVADLPDEEWSVARSATGSGGVGDYSAVVEAASSRRGVVVPPEFPEDDDVIDPYRRSDEVYRRSADEIGPAVATIIAQLSRAATVTGE
jgi:protein-tyrosine phosphatase